MAGEAPSPPRASGLLVASLALSGISILPGFRLGPIGPLAAGVLAFLGTRAVRRSGGAIRGPVLAKVAMTAALAALLLVAWAMVRHEAAARAFGEIRARVAAVEEALRTGTAEGAWERLSPEGWVAGPDRDHRIGQLRSAMARLGPLESLAGIRQDGQGEDWVPAFEEGERAEVRLPLDFEARFQNGRGRVLVEVVVRREGRAVAGSIADLQVTPVGP